MNSVTVLQTQAIQAAQSHQWDDAISLNKMILEQEPQNISALNRLGFCQLQIRQCKEARNVYKEVLSIDPYNTIARKYLSLLSSSENIAVAEHICLQEHFIEEPGKTKTTHLCRLADPQKLLMIPIGTKCKFLIKKHWITVVTQDDEYIGSLPDDISHYLTRFIEGGNTYKVIVKAIDKTTCTVFIKEVKRAKKFGHTPSFPVASIQQSTEIHEKLLVEDDRGFGGDSDTPEDQIEEEPEQSEDEFSRDRDQ